MEDGRKHEWHDAERLRAREFAERLEPMTEAISQSARTFHDVTLRARALQTKILLEEALEALREEQPSPAAPIASLALQDLAHALDACESSLTLSYPTSGIEHAWYDETREFVFGDSEDKTHSGLLRRTWARWIATGVAESQRV